MIDKIINVLLAMGVTFLAGYGLWEIHGLAQEPKIILSFIGFGGLLSGALYFKNSNTSFSQYLGLVAFSYYSKFTYEVFELIPEPSAFIHDLKYCGMAALGVLFFYTFFKKVVPSLIYFTLSILAGLVFAGTILNLIREYLNIHHVISLTSVFILWQLHTYKLPINSMINKLLNLTNITGDRVYDSNHELIGGLAIFGLLASRISLFGLGFLPFFMGTTLFIGLLLSLNNKLKAIQAGFWFSLALMFFHVYQNISLSTSTLVLLSGVGCIILAYALKTLKNNPEVFKKLQDNIPQFLKQYQIKD